MRIYRENPFEPAAEELAKIIFNNSDKDPNEIATQYVKSKGYNAEQTKRVLQTANIKLFHMNMKQGKHEFEVINPDLVVSSLFEKTASEISTKKELPDEFFIVEKETLGSLSKVAYSKTPDEKWEFKTTKSEKYKELINKAKKAFYQE